MHHDTVQCTQSLLHTYRLRQETSNLISYNDPASHCGESQFLCLPNFVKTSHACTKSAYLMCHMNKPGITGDITPCLSCITATKLPLNRFYHIVRRYRWTPHHHVIRTRKVYTNNMFNRSGATFYSLSIFTNAGNVLIRRRSISARNTATS